MNEEQEGLCENDKNKDLSHSFIEALLIKYMRHVRECEGVDFVEDINSYKSDVIFTNEEEQTLIGYSSR